MKAPQVSVGVLFAKRIKFTLHTPYLINGQETIGPQEVYLMDKQIVWNHILYDELVFIPIDSDTAYFELKDVTIGINFHWQRDENQQFRGSLRIIVEEDKLTAINILPVEEYLVSVISSEMSANASLELLKAHAVISRSWLLAQIQKNKDIQAKQFESTDQPIQTETEHIVWYDKEDHSNFDVCADDHCQRYQGITRATTPLVQQAVDETEGEILMYNGRICDARFSKCCGGVFEEFSSCWENSSHPYLSKKRDSLSSTTIPNLKKESEAESWILGSAEALCNTTDKQILSQVLNNYDQETTDFYRWRVSYTQQELAQLIYKNTGIDFGGITDLKPLTRGTSARLITLQIKGTKKTLTIGKELEIRRILSNSHLYSSAFVVQKGELKDGLPQQFTLIGAGWGHGVGLCQIGAAVMGEQGKTYEEILLHYYIDAEIKKNY
ncbi:MAG: SpoIID/LytB domain-containing protein [Bacteroides sp.]